MNQYEVTFIVDPVLSGDEIEGTAKTYLDHLKGEGCKIVNTEEIGLRQLAYSIKKRTTGIYYCIEFQSESGGIVPKLELALRRDERIMRFLTVALDKYGVKYNDDKRNGLIGRKRKEEEEDSSAAEKSKSKATQSAKPAKPAPAKPAPAKVAAAEPAPVAAAAVAESAPAEPAAVEPVVTEPTAVAAASEEE